MTLSTPVGLDSTLGGIAHPCLQRFGPLPLEAAATQSCLYIYDLIAQKTLSLTASVATLLGYATETVSAAEDLSLAHLIHPADLDRVAEHFQCFSTLRHREVITLEYRMRHVDDTWRWLRSHESLLIATRDGLPLQILGMVQLLPSPGAIAVTSVTT
jgi:PAS domain-containing protein